MSDSSKASSPTLSRPPRSRRSKGERSSTQVGFEFLNITHPQEAKGEEARRTVRSHVTKKQHQREQLAAAAAGRSKSAPQIATAGPSKSQPPRLRTANTIATVSPDSTSFDLFSATSPGPSTGRSSPVKSAAVSPQLASAASSSTPSRHSPGIDLQEWHPSVSFLLDHYISSLSAVSSDLNLPSPSILHQKWRAFVLSSDTLFHATLLFAAAHALVNASATYEQIDIDHFRTTAITGLNKLLRSPTESLADSTIAAAVHMAAFEALFGDVDAYGMHMGGVQQLVHLRGGLGELGVEGLLARVVVFFDVNAAYATHGQRFLGGLGIRGDESKMSWQGENAPMPDPTRFGRRIPLMVKQQDSQDWWKV